MPAGKTVALVGASGSGKSTAATLLLRLRTPTSGRIAVDDHDYWDFSASSWHGFVAVVEQEAFLFHDTMARNIGYGFPEVSMQQIEEAVRLAYLEDVVNQLPDGLDTVVGERGTLFSGGAAPTTGHRPRAGAQSASPHSGRGHVGAGQHFRASGAGRTGKSPARTHRPRHRPPPLNHSQRRPHCGPERRPRVGTGNLGQTGRFERKL